MANINTIFLKWDGLCTAKVKELTPANDWCNARDVGEGSLRAPPAESVEPVSAPHHGFQGMGARIESPRATISLVALDKVFAPAEEYALVQLKIKNLEKAGQLVLQVRDATGALVYAERLSQSQVRGLPATREAALATAPRLATREADEALVADDKRAQRAARSWASPSKSPYRVTVLISNLAVTTRDKMVALPAVDSDPSRLDPDTGKSSVPPRALDATADPDQVSVVVHSVEIEPMPWADVYRLATKETVLTYPTGKGPRIETMWVQYKLNELGFYAGPLDGDVHDAELSKAIVRYRQADPDLSVKRYQKDGFVFVLDPGVTLDGTVTTALLDKLKAGTGPRTTFDDAKVFTGENPGGKLYVDNDRLMQDAVTEFAMTKQDATQSIKNTYEAGWHSPPRIPLRAKAMVTTRGGAKRWVPESVAQVAVDWSWSDVAQDLAVFPAVTATEPSRSREYVETALARIQEILPAKYHNTPALLGGQITGELLRDRQVVFQQLGEFALKAGTEADTWGVRVTGGAVYFTPSLVGGDNYKLKAEVGARSKETGKIEVWRRVRIACHVSWSASPPSAVWDAVIKDYVPAFIEVVPPAVMKPMAEVADATLKGWFTGQLGALGLPAPDRRFSDDFYDPRDLSGVITVTQTDADAINAAVRALLDANGHLTTWETTGTANAVRVEMLNVTARLEEWRTGRYGALSTLAKDTLIEQAQEYFKKELDRIKALRNPPDSEYVRSDLYPTILPWRKANATVTFKPLVGPERRLKPFVADAAALAVAQRGKVDQLVYHQLVNETQVDLMLHIRRIVGPGIMVLEVDPHAPVTIAGAPYVSLAVPSLSPGGEVVFFNRAMYGAYKLYMLFAHEMAHCFFLKHHKNADPYLEWDHDQKDENCMMSYAYEEGKTGKFIAGIGDHYKDGNYTPHFCGKCLLQLRGWNLRAKEPKNAKKDVLPDFTGLRPLPRLKRAEGPVDVPSPAIIQTAAVALMKGLVAEDDVGQYWLRGTGVSDAGRVMAIANPFVKGEKIEWEVLPIRSFPEGTPLPKPHGDMGVPTYWLKHKLDTKNGRDEGWTECMKMWSETAALTNNAGVPLVVSCPGYGFTDLMHETCHFFQKWSTEIAFFEGTTEVFAGLLSVGVRRELGVLGQGAHDAKFVYSFNHSYSEVTLSAIDKWLPRLGVQALGEIYVKDAEGGRFDAMFRDKNTYLNHLMDVTRDDLHLRNLMAVDSPVDPIMNERGELRADLEEKVAASGPLEADLRVTIKAFLDTLDVYASRVSEKQKRIIASKSDLAKTYAKARMVRLTAKQMGKVRMLREARAMKERETRDQVMFLGTRLDSFIEDTSNELTALCRETDETEEELLRVLPPTPYAPPV